MSFGATDLILKPTLALLAMCPLGQVPQSVRVCISSNLEAEDNHWPPTLL